MKSAAYSSSLELVNAACSDKSKLVAVELATDRKMGFPRNLRDSIAEILLAMPVVQGSLPQLASKTIAVCRAFPVLKGLHHLHGMSVGEEIIALGVVVFSCDRQMSYEFRSFLEDCVLGRREFVFNVQSVPYRAYCYNA